LQIWLDRSFDPSPESYPSLDPVSVPRAITSRSVENQSDGVSAMVRNKRQCKIDAVEAEIERIQNPVKKLSDEEVLEKLKKVRAGWKKVGI